MAVKVHMKTVKSNRLNAKEARALILSGSRLVIKDLLTLATGQPNPDVPEGRRIGVDDKARKMVMNAIIPMLQQAGDVQKVEAESTQDVIGLLKEGVVTFVEAKELMQMLSTKSEIDDLKKLLEKMNDLQISNQ